MLLYNAKQFIQEFVIGSHFSGTMFSTIPESKQGKKINLKNDLTEYKPVKKRLTHDKKTLPTKSIDRESFSNHEVDVKGNK